MTPVAATAETVVGRAHVVDGDTLDVGDRVVRLFGIDAPEFDQPCTHEGKSVPAARRLQDNWPA
jgi:endonuclease YncB( thermonuclease family)